MIFVGWNLRTCSCVTIIYPQLVLGGSFQMFCVSVFVDDRSSDRFVYYLIPLANMGCELKPQTVFQPHTTTLPRGGVHVHPWQGQEVERAFL